MIVVKLDRLLVERKVRLTDLARRVGLSLSNLSLFKNGRVKELRFGLLDALCRELGCQPGELFAYQPDPPAPALPRQANVALDFLDQGATRRP